MEFSNIEMLLSLVVWWAWPPRPFGAVLGHLHLCSVTLMHSWTVGPYPHHLLHGRWSSQPAGPRELGSGRKRVEPHLSGLKQGQGRGQVLASAWWCWHWVSSPMGQVGVIARGVTVVLWGPGVMHLRLPSSHHLSVYTAHSDTKDRLSFFQLVMWSWANRWPLWTSVFDPVQWLKSVTCSWWD